MKLDYKFDPKSKYVVAVSFGPDSMALLNMLLLENIDVVVAHVNYHRRPESNFEEESLRKFCKEHNVPIEVLDTSNLKPEKNFQAWARKIRYDFFKKVSEEYNAIGVLVAHQEDDLIETFIMQKNRGSVVKNYGIAKEVDIYGVHIIRPLLSFSKKMLQDYCYLNEVPYSIDSSNLENHYERNLIRHTIVENMSDKDRANTIEEIKKLQESKNAFENINNISLELFNSLSDEKLINFISNFLNNHDEHIDLSKSFLDEMRKAFSSRKSNVEIKLVDGLVISKEYDEIYLLDKNEFTDYEIELDKPDTYSDDFFDIDFRVGGEERNITNDSYPIIIKPVKNKDIYKVNNYKVEVRRLFIDWKVPPHLRSVWPGIFDRSGKLIYIPRYRKEFVDEHTSKFVIKFTK